MKDKKKKIIISFDDIDTVRGGCTTHFAATIIKLFLSKGWELVDYPYLVRLNPDIPWKTRGNAAIAIILTKENGESLNHISNVIEKELKKYISSNEPVMGNSQPTFLVADYNYLYIYAEFFHKLYKTALKKNLNVKKIEKELSETYKNVDRKIIIKSIFGNRGVIGALASIGFIFGHEDYTFELLAYTKNKNKDTRYLTELYQFFLKHEDLTTFNNIDIYSRKSIITPHGPDPVLFGLRGNNPLILLHLFHRIIKYFGAAVDSWIIFKTNQGTDAHHMIDNRLSSYSLLYSQYDAIGWKIKKEKILPSGHHIYKVAIIDQISLSTRNFDLSSYRESLKMRDILEKINDKHLFLILGNLRPFYKTSETTINLEKNYVIYSRARYNHVKPLCIKCFNHLESTGKDGYFRCRKCRYRMKIREKVKLVMKSTITPTVLHEPPMYQRHLTKPLRRFGREEISKSSEAEEIILKIMNKYV